MTDLTDKLADALEKALIPVACFVITDKEMHYREIGPDLRQGMNQAHDGILEALLAYRAQRDGDDGCRRLQKGEEIVQGDQFQRVSIQWLDHVAYLGERFDPEFHDPSRRPLAKGEA